MLRRFALYLTTILVATACAALLVEATVRLVIDDGLQFDLEMWKYAKEIKVPSQDPAIGHEHRPNTSAHLMGVDVTINSLGLRSPELKSDKTTRVLMLGDSLTFGWGVEAKDTVSRQLEAILTESAPDSNFEVVNSGVGNYNTSMQAAYFLSKGKALKPDVVVINYFINDAEPTPVRKSSLWREYSYALVVLAGAVDTVKRLYFGAPDWKAFYHGLYQDNAPGWLAAKRAIADISAYCRDNNIPLLLVYQPELHELNPYPFADVTAALQKTATENGVPFLDLLPTVKDHAPETLWVTPTDAHPNRIATTAFAQAIASELQLRFPALWAR